MEATEKMKHRIARLEAMGDGLRLLGLLERRKSGSKSGANVFIDTIEWFAMQWSFTESPESPWLQPKSGWSGLCLIAGEPATITVTPCLLPKFCYCTVTPVQLTDGKRKAAGKVTLTPRRRDRLAAWLAVQRVSHVRMTPQFGMRPWLPAEAVASVALSSPKAIVVVRDAAATPPGEKAEHAFRVRIGSDVGRSVWLSKAHGLLAVTSPDLSGSLPSQWHPIGRTAKKGATTMRGLRSCIDKQVTGTMGTALRNGRNKASPT